VVERGPDVENLRVGDWVGIPWLASACGLCRYCTTSRENLCDNAQFTGYTVDGGYAEYAVAHARFCFGLPDGFTDEELAPWLCAGFIGHRALRIAGDAARLGIYGFGASGQIVAQLARHEGRKVFAFTRPGDDAARVQATPNLARSGPVEATNGRRPSWTRPSCSRRWVRWCLRRYAMWRRAAPSYAPEST
jgi:propanol-preferring alcohol dehydrogenase